MRIKQFYGVLSLVLASSAIAGGARLSYAAASDNEAFSVVSIAPGVFYHAGAQAEANKLNHGDIANIGFIVGERCVAVIDTGGSPAVGHALQKAILGTTAKPVCYVINTHMHPDHVFGNSAFKRPGTTFVAAEHYSEGLAARARTYLDRMRSVLDLPASIDWIVMPDETVEETLELDLGNRKIRLHAWPTSHTNNDLTVFDEKTGTLWLGDLLFVDRVPALDGSITGWLGSVERLHDRTDVRYAVPGHGPPGSDWPRMLDPEIAYLTDIRGGVENALDEGRSLKWAEQHVALDGREDWLLFDDYHARNVSGAYTELEWQ